MRARRGFTLVELLTVIGIISVLVALLLAAVQAARESARKTQCMNNLKQISLAFLTHESLHGFLPTSGWGYGWIGEPDAGYGRDQPGGWAYNILPFVEQNQLRDLGRGVTDLTAHREALTTLVSTPVSLFYCPSRRAVTTYVYSGSGSLAVNLPTCTTNECYVVRGDYRANSGNINSGGDFGPGLGDDPAFYPWMFAAPNEPNGITYQRSMVRLAEITDGATKTAMVGEKYVIAWHYEDGRCSSDDQSLYTGFDQDNNGFTGDVSEIYSPRRDALWVDLRFHFGSAHPSGFLMACCDGSVRNVDFDVDRVVFYKFGGRNDE